MSAPMLVLALLTSRAPRNHRVAQCSVLQYRSVMNVRTLRLRVTQHVEDTACCSLWNCLFVFAGTAETAAAASPGG